MGRPFVYVLGYASKLLGYLLLLIAGILLLAVILLAGNIRDFKSIYSLGVQGKDELMAAANQAQTRDWDGALKNSQAAEQDFTKVLEHLSAAKQNVIIAKVPALKTQVNDLEYLFRTTEIISRSLARSIPLAKKLSDISSGAIGSNFASLPEEERAEFLKLIYESEPEFTGLEANLELALYNIDKIHRIGILWPIYGQISGYRTQLLTANGLLAKLTPLTKLLPALGGYPNGSDFLIILQNNDELRPTGGFIGAYGLARTKNGKIVSLDTEDSYHLDMPALGKWQKEPPLPLKKYLEVENWYLRDANWVPDWPLAAQKINEIYTGESQAIGQIAPDFSGIIAINPDFIADLIRLVGPINVKGEDYTADNFQELLQYNVEIAYKDRNISSWDRKEIINELLKQLQLRLFDLPSKDWGALLNILDDNIAAKNIQIYFADKNLENLAEDLGADGKIKASASDYLMVVDANLAAYKSDAVVKKNIAYNVSQRNGTAAASLVLGYRHEGDFDWRTTRYRSYTRIYVPLGSRLAAFSGLDPAKADWTAIDDPITGKTIFEFFFTVEPGTEKEITINYTLPDNINRQITAGNYELLVQKQSGRRTEKLEVSLDRQAGDDKKWTDNLKTDKVFKY